MEYEKMKVSEVKPNEYNPRKISEKDYNNLKKSLKEFGILRPLIINKINGSLISGHQMLKAAIELKIEELPVIYVSLSEEKEKALNLAMNKISGEFEEDKLIELIEQINSTNEDVIGLTGFSTEEINYLLGLKARDKEDIFARSQEDDFDISNKYGIKIGDIVRLDDQWIICGNSTDPNNLKKLIGDKKIDLIVTSPPYNLDIQYGKYRDNKEYRDYIEMIRKVFLNIKDFIERGRFICVNIGREWGPINMPAKYDNIFEEIGFIFFRNIYWKKPAGAARGTITARNPFPRYYVPKVQTEIIQIYQTDEMPEIANQMITYKFSEGEKIRQEKIPEIMLSKYAGNVWDMMTETTLGQEHPAPFPQQLSFNCIRFFSFEKERVLDPFMGSGTTLLSCQQLNRKFYGIEIDPAYVSLAIERYLMMFPNGKLEITSSLDPKEKVL
jgi:DNA modification methylase